MPDTLVALHNNNICRGDMTVFINVKVTIRKSARPGNTGNHAYSLAGKITAGRKSV